ncbi:MAG: hypothetical protein E6J34_00940 [Chloroflexi bacterium]|nr:MAG: hypothetical protein E6J34_00940 [Chloroflexota bacterium]
MLTWYALQWRRLYTTQERTEHVEQEQVQEIRRLEQSLQAIEVQAHTLRVARQQLQTQISEARKASAEADSGVQKIERELAVDEERVVGFERQHGDIQQEERRLRERLLALQKQLIDLEEQCDLADEAVDSNAASLAELEVNVTRAQKDYEMDERRLRSAQHDLVQVQARLGSTQTELGRLQKQLGERNHTLAARRATIAQAQQSLHTIEARLIDERARLTSGRDEEQQVTQRKQGIVRAMADAQQELEHLKGTLAEAERRRRAISDRVNMLKNWRHNLSGYSDGVRALLRAPAGRLSGLIGPVPQLAVVPVGLELALEAALGPYMQAVVVQTFADALRCQDYLQSVQPGKAIVVWAEREEDDAAGREVELIQAQVEEAVLQRFLAEKVALKDRIGGFAWCLVQCDSRFLTLLRRLLRGIVIACDLEAARELLAWAMPLSLSSENDLPFSSVVTLRGEVLHVDGWLVGGGSKDSAQQGLLAYERELRELPQQLEEQKALIDQFNGMISELQRAQEGRRVEQNALDKELQKIVMRINELHKTVNASQREQERLQTEIRLAGSVEQQLAAEVAGLGQELVAVQERVRGHDKTQHEMKGLVEELQYEMEERAVTYRRQQDELGKARTALALKRQEAKSLQQQLSVQRTQAQDLKSQVGQQVARLQENEQRKQALQQAIATQHDQLTQARAQAQTLLKELHIVESKLGAVDQQIATVEQQRLRVQKAMAEQETSYRRALLDSQKARNAVETLVEQLREELGIDDPNRLATYAMSMEVTADGGAEDSSDRRGNGSRTMQSSNTGLLTGEEEAQLRRLRRRVDTLRNRLKAMGGCDENAPQMYEETRIRHEFLSSQIADMDQAALQLRTIIGQLDATMARQFEVTFQAINARFREHFTTLFNGGTASLELTAAKAQNNDSSAPSGMAAGVEVIVQPPGKKVQDLSLLSGGERALVSAALLFSLLEIHPPPFCLLDEVDAALDESNVTRFCDILKRLAQRTQFIVITHNRVTMTVAQVMYGVSMRDSVSRLLSMRLDEAVVVGDR